ncbi:deazaflavin-dependent oxidoreductase, nitroreductase family [Parafrankia irregularis]|uniref:Deazaflavin-dependent oxidoreductase, nitroreductase family n=1 Tax=Parafrankia irregularis TaxID=795642 RepID=A0A0S4QWF8_9ACTN|nr:MULTISPECIES: nitroreductase/quinone reductase family protein [Parafrankia]MBE3201956.1 nitroreductase family deazaflavin-dependent oxidoreductase [Parafrankia sp. CH37]CUU59455.1 deazaflavin-dependent oxidoreductase, nitroreductase family [Parafrankia irregularis]
MTETRPAQSREFDFRVVNQAVINEYRATGGKLEKTLAGSRLLLLTTVGETTGRPHTTPLGYVPDESDAADGSADAAGSSADAAGGSGEADRSEGSGSRRLVVYASNMAAGEHPQWYRNLLAQPKVTVEVDTDRFDAQASTATGAQRERLYEALVEGMPGIRSHQEQTTREIPVVILAPLR